MRCSPFDTVAMVNAALASFVVDVKVLEVVVKIDRAGTEISSKKGSVSCEDSSDINVSLAAAGNDAELASTLER